MKTRRIEMFTVCSLFVHCLFMVCSRFVHGVFTVGSHVVHTLLRLVMLQPHCSLLVPPANNRPIFTRFQGASNLCAGGGRRVGGRHSRTEDRQDRPKHLYLIGVRTAPTSLPHPTLRKRLIHSPMCRRQARSTLGMSPPRIAKGVRGLQPVVQAPMALRDLVPAHEAHRNARGRLPITAQARRQDCPRWRRRGRRCRWPVTWLQAFHDRKCSNFNQQPLCALRTHGLW